MNNKKQTTEERRAMFEKAALQVKKRLEANKDTIAKIIEEIKEEKYEGHTPDEWIVEQGANGDTLVSSFHPNENGLQTDIALVYSCDKTHKQTQADAQLIADAPLLLAEVKRLRKALQEFKEGSR
tara:strand:- start:1848 stop:2222 length:375 start_codon:yes stop_codon:yes gene_type:complete